MIEHKKGEPTSEKGGSQQANEVDADPTQAEVEALFWKDLGQELLAHLDALPQEDTTPEQLANRRAKLTVGRIIIRCEELFDIFPGYSVALKPVHEYFQAIDPTADDKQLYAACHVALMNSTPDIISKELSEALFNFGHAELAVNLGANQS